MVKRIITYTVCSVLITLIASAADHEPVWSGANSITYNLRDIDNFNPQEYEHTRWGNKIDEVYYDFLFDPQNKTLSFSQLTEEHLSTNTNQDTWDLFLSGTTNTLNRIIFPTSPSIWDWDNNLVTFYGSGDFYLFRYFHFEDVPADPGGNVLSSSATKLVILIHGWNPNSNADPYSGAEFTDLYTNITSIVNGTDWTVFRYDWAVDADTGGIQTSATDSTEAAEHGHQHGQHLGDLLNDYCPNLTNVHFIAHSAGSWVARGAVRNLLDANPNITVGVTLLDPYMPNEIWFNDSSLGEPLMSLLDEVPQSNRIYKLENYYSDDLIVPGTQEVFNWRISIDKNMQTNIYAISRYDGHDGPTNWLADTALEAAGTPVANLSGYDLATYGWRQSMFFNEPIILTQPNNLEINVTEQAAFSVTASTRDLQSFPGDSQSPPINYQWYKWNGSSWDTVAGATSNAFSIPNTESSDQGYYAVAVFNTAGFAASNTVELSVASFLNWINTFTEIPVNQRDAEDDYDLDGMSNLYEYALNLNPAQKGDNPAVSGQTGGEDTFTLTYTRHRTDVTYSVETSTNLDNWTTNGVDQGSSELGSVTASITMAPEPRRFLRLKITQL
jgi:hypothetical protein